MNKKPTVDDLFIARRIAEFPTLYPHGGQVIFSCVISTMGSCYWDKNGLLQQDDQFYNAKTKKFTKYPLKMPMSTALGLVYDIGQSIHPYYNMNGPINNMPLNIHEDWLTRISCFLTTWGKYTMDDFKLMATHHCLLQYGLRENPNARLQQRRIDDFKQFHKKIPSWKAMVDSIRYQKQYNKIDIRTFQAADI
jgi:hypothetical protein